MSANIIMSQEDEKRETTNTRTWFEWVNGTNNNEKLNEDNKVNENDDSNMNEPQMLAVEDDKIFYQEEKSSWCFWQKKENKDFNPDLFESYEKCLESTKENTELKVLCEEFFNKKENEEKRENE